MAGLSKELKIALKAMSKAKTVEGKVAYRQRVKNLCKSLGEGRNLANDILIYGIYE